MPDLPNRLGNEQMNAEMQYKDSRERHPEIDWERRVG